MKKNLLCILLIVFCSSFLFGQNFMNRIGDFKMYDSPSKLAELGFTNPKQVRSKAEYTNMKFSNSKNNLYEIITDTINGDKFDDFQNYYNPQIKSFYFRSMEIAKDIILKNVRIIYYKDSLISFTCYDSPQVSRNMGLSKLEDIYTTKYGIKSTKEEKNTKENSNTSTVSYETSLPNITCFISTKIYKYVYGKTTIIKSLNFYDKAKRIESQIEERHIEKRIKSKNSNYSNL